MPWQEYATETGNEDYDLILLFLPDNQYELAFYYINPKFPDQPDGLTLSMGMYETKGSMLIMHDKLLGFQWCVQRREDGLLIKSGFQFMRENLLTFYRTAQEPADKTQIKFDYRTRLVKEKSMQQPYNSLSKSYSWNYFKLYLENDHSYRLLHHGKVVISEGIWSREGNILTITDSALKTPFYGIILPDGLESMLLPGLYRGPVLNKYEIDRSSLVRQE